MAAYGFHPLFDNIMKQERLDKNMFSFYYNRHEDSYDSQMTLGGVDKSLYTGEIDYHPVSHEYYWAIKADNIRYGDKDLGICSGGRGCTVVADTGTSLLTGPNRDLDKLLSSALSDTL